MNNITGKFPTFNNKRPKRANKNTLFRMTLMPVENIK